MSMIQGRLTYSNDERRYLNRDFKQDYHVIQGILKMIAHMIISQTFLTYLCYLKSYILIMI